MIKSLPKKIQNAYERIPASFKNRYSLLFGAFFVYMLFFDIWKERRRIMKERLKRHALCEKNLNQIKKNMPEKNTLCINQEKMFSL